MFLRGCRGGDSCGKPRLVLSDSSDRMVIEHVAAESRNKSALVGL